MTFTSIYRSIILTAITKVPSLNLNLTCTSTSQSTRIIRIFSVMSFCTSRIKFMFLMLKSCWVSSRWLNMSGAYSATVCASVKSIESIGPNLVCTTSLAFLLTDLSKSDSNSMILSDLNLLPMLIFVSLLSLISSFVKSIYSLFLGI